jgi:hypothetical protein
MLVARAPWGRWGPVIYPAWSQKKKNIHPPRGYDGRVESV